ncbi:MAG: hypothetical protein ACYCWW_10375 [Deltaproteobacteria bacterium]
MIRSHLERLLAPAAPFRLRSTQLALGILFACAVGFPFLPLVELPGYELAEALTLLVGALGGAVGIELAGTPQGRARPARMALAAGATLSTGVLLTTAIVLGVALGRGRCDPWRGLPFVALLPIPSALLGVTLGTLVGRAVERRWLAGIAYALLGLGTLAVTAAPILTGPQVFAYNPLFGWFPGPLYDEALPLPPPLVAYRALALLVTGALLALLAAMAAKRPRRWLWLACGIGALYVVGVSFERRLGIEISTADVERSLGGHLELSGLTLYFPRELRGEEAERLARLAALDLDEVSKTLGIASPGPIEILVYRSAEEKGRLTGASQTRFTKPWLRQIDIQQGDDRLLRHELVHAVASVWGRPPFDVCASLLGLAIQPGIVEGLAVAVDWPADELTVHEWSHAMQEAGLAPDIRAIVGPLGFAAQSQARAYTLAGSFLRYLLDRYGRERLARLYHAGDFGLAYGRPLAALAADWEAFLSHVPLDARARGAARDRFFRPALFGRPCARELASLEDEARAAEGAENYPRAAELLGRCHAIDPRDAALLAAVWRTERRAGDAAAAATERELSALPALDPIVRAELEIAKGDDAWSLGRLDAAKGHFDEALSQANDPATRRGLELRLLALDRPKSAAALRGYFDDPGSDLSLLALLEAREAEPGVAATPYLLGLRLCQRERREEGLRLLAAALELGLPAGVAAQALRVTASAQIDLGRWADAEDTLVKLEALHRPAAEALLRLDLSRRLAFERSHFDRPLVH